MHISVVVPFHGVERYIEACVTALVGQDYPRDRFEIIFVDNNSPDRSAEIVRRYPQVRLLSESKPGPYAARNRGVNASTGEILAFLDSDCVPVPGWLRRVDAAMSDPAIHVVLGRRLLGSDSGAVGLLADYDAARAAYVFSSRRREIYYGYAGNMAVRRIVFEQVGSFPEWMRGGDTALVNRIVNQYPVECVRFDPDMVVRHLEIDSVAAWVAKMYTYARSSRRYTAATNHRPLDTADRRRIFRNAMRARRRTPGASLIMLSLLGLGFAAWEFGRRFGPPIPER